MYLIGGSASLKVSKRVAREGYMLSLSEKSAVQKLFSIKRWSSLAFDSAIKIILRVRINWKIYLQVATRSNSVIFLTNLLNGFSQARRTFIAL